MAPAAIPAAAPRQYRPRSYTNDLKEIVEDHLDDLVRVWDERFAKDHGPLHPRVKDLLERFCRCGDPQFGFLRLRCANEDCTAKGEKIVPYSCKSRGACPSCGQKRAIAWAERMVEEVLPDVAYVGLVFTIPKMLRKAFLFERKLYGELCRAAYAATRKFFEVQFPGLEKAVPAFVAAPQSFGSLVNFHPHCHALCSLGVFTRDGIFHPVPDDVDFSALEELFRDEVFRAFLNCGAITEERVGLLRSWRHSGFHVDASRRVAEGERAELESVLQYIDRPPVSLKRLEYLADGRVHYRGKHVPSLGRDHQLCSGVEFLALLIPHIALRYECRIQSFGALSTTIRRQLGWIRAKEEPASAPDVVEVEEDESEFVRLRRANWARLISRTWLEDPSLCACCGQPMKVISAINSPAQDDVIEKILRARNEWDPPWTRQRRARSPPRQLEMCSDEVDEECSQLRPETDEEFDQDTLGALDPL